LAEGCCEAVCGELVAGVWAAFESDSFCDEFSCPNKGARKSRQMKARIRGRMRKAYQARTCTELQDSEKSWTSFINLFDLYDFELCRWTAIFISRASPHARSAAAGAEAQLPRWPLAARLKPGPDTRRFTRSVLVDRSSLGSRAGIDTLRPIYDPADCHFSFKLTSSISGGLLSQSAEMWSSVMRTVLVCPGPIGTRLRSTRSG
jgi:hypothetical protein